MPYHLAWSYWRAIPSFEARYVLTLLRGLGLAFGGSDNGAAIKAKELLDDAFPNSEPKVTS